MFLSYGPQRKSTLLPCTLYANIPHPDCTANDGCSSRHIHIAYMVQFQRSLKTCYTFSIQIMKEIKIIKKKPHKCTDLPFGNVSKVFLIFIYLPFSLFDIRVNHIKSRQFEMKISIDLHVHWQAVRTQHGVS